MWGFRRQVSLLLDSGHAHAFQYPLGMVWEEARLVVERRNHTSAHETALLHAAAAAIFSKEGMKNLKKILKELDDG